MSAKPEWSHRVHVSDVYRRASRKGVYIKLSVDDEIKQSLAERMSVKSLNDFKAEVELTPVTQNTVRIEGKFSAAVEIKSLLGAEVYSHTVSDKFTELLTTSEAVYHAANGDDTDGDDVVELIEGDMIDVAEITVQYLMLASDDMGYEENSYIEDQEAIDREKSGKTNALAAALQNSGISNES